MYRGEKKSKAAAGGGVATASQSTYVDSHYNQNCSIDQIDSALSYVPSDDRTIWIQIGMAIHSELGDTGFLLWDQWSRSAGSYNQRDAESAWKSFTHGAGVTVGTLFHLAKQYGWCWSGSALSQVEITKQRDEAKVRNRNDLEKREEMQQVAALTSQRLWGAGKPANNNPYLIRKRCEDTETLRQLHIDGVMSILSYRPQSRGEFLQGLILLVPVEVDGQICTIEMIDQDGRKSAVKDGKKSGGFWISQQMPENEKYSGTIIIGEGVATVLSVKQATNHLGVAALSCHNLGMVAIQMRQRYPKAKITVLADVGNGQGEAERAAREADCLCAVPEFPEDAQGKDFNDLLQVSGTVEVKRQVEVAKPVLHASVQEVEPATEGELPLAEKLRPGSYYTSLTITINWIIQGYIPELAVILLFGRGGMGKTTLLMQIFGAVAKGLDLFGIQTSKRPVIYVDYENSLPVLVERCRNIDASGILFLDSTSNPPQLDSQEREQYLDLLAIYPGSVIIFDTLKSAHRGDENDSRPMSDVMGFLRNLRDAGATVIILHHTPKGNARQYKGSGAIFDLCDHVLALYPVKKPGDESEVIDDDDTDVIYRFGTSQKTRYEPARMFLSFNSDTRRFVAAPDPDVQHFETIKQTMQRLALRGAVINQTNLLNELSGSIPQKKVCRMLTTGIGSHWNVEKGLHNANIYTPIETSNSVPQSCAPIYSKETAKLETGQSNYISNPVKLNTIDTYQTHAVTESDSTASTFYPTDKREASQSVIIMDDSDFLFEETDDAC